MQLLNASCCASLPAGHDAALHHGQGGLRQVAVCCLVPHAAACCACSCTTPWARARRGTCPPPPTHNSVPVASCRCRRNPCCRQLPPLLPGAWRPRRRRFSGGGQGRAAAHAGQAVLFGFGFHDPLKHILLHHKWRWWRGHLRAASTCGPADHAGGCLQPASR